MRKTYLILASIFTVISIVTSILPLDTIALLPIGIALVFGFLGLSKSGENQVKFPKLILLICGLCSIFVMGKTLLITDKVEVDQQFEQKKVETKKEAQKDLEELEDLQ